MASSTVTSKGQITIPKAIRERLGLEEGSVLEFIVDESGQVFLRPRADDGMDRVFGALREFAPKRPVTVDEMKAVVKARAARKARGGTR
jgi:antitoxin PrlF